MSAGQSLQYPKRGTSLSRVRAASRPTAHFADEARDVSRERRHGATAVGEGGIASKRWSEALRGEQGPTRVSTSRHDEDPQRHVHAYSRMSRSAHQAHFGALLMYPS